MQKKTVTILIVFLLSLLSKFSQAQPADAVLSYIARYKDLAIAEMQRTGIPAAITLAQGIHETDAGTSELVRKSNNHFGIKCKEDWSGPTVSHDDDARGECFRKYDVAEQSYRDHSDFLKTRSNYASLFKLDPTDYQGWAYGLKKAGYATNPKYAQILIKLIQDYDLEDYTLIALGKMSSKEGLVRNDKSSEKISQASNKDGYDKKVDAMPAVSVETSYPSGEFRINDTRVIFVKKGTSYLDIAQHNEISLSKLFEFNDLKPQEVTATDQLVYLQRKRKTGEHEFHIVQPEESLNSISQAEAIRLESLREYNHLTPDVQPAVGESLSLRSKTSFMPRLITKTILADKL